MAAFIVRFLVAERLFSVTARARLPALLPVEFSAAAKSEEPIAVAPHSSLRRRSASAASSAAVFGTGAEGAAAASFAKLDELIAVAAPNRSRAT